MGNIIKKPKALISEPSHSPYKFVYSPEEEEDIDGNKENIPPQDVTSEKKKTTNDACSSNKRTHDSQN